MTLDSCAVQVLLLTYGRADTVPLRRRSALDASTINYIPAGCTSGGVVAVVGVVPSGNAAVLLDEPGVGRHDHHVQLQLTAPQLLQVPDLQSSLLAYNRSSVTPTAGHYSGVTNGVRTGSEGPLPRAEQTRGRKNSLAKIFYD